MGFFDYQSGNRRGIRDHLLDMNPVVVHSRIDYPFLNFIALASRPVFKNCSNC